MRVMLEVRHPELPLRRPECVSIDVPDGPDAPLPTLPSVPVLYEVVRDALGVSPWFLKFVAGDPVTCVLCPEDPDGGGDWVEAPPLLSRAPWASWRWRREASDWIGRHVGPHRLRQHRVWGRSIILRVAAEGGAFWFKESYGLPPGEGTALSLAGETLSETLATPELVAADGTRALMRPMDGVPLAEAPELAWAAAIRAIVRFQQEADVERWAAAGCRDVRRQDWPVRLVRLFATCGLDARHADRLYGGFDALGELPPCVLPQDLGPCNLRWSAGRAIAYDWSDVVIDAPGFLLNRFLAECATAEWKAAVTEVWLDTWGAGAGAALQAAQACARLHNAVRYDDELAWLDEDEPLAGWLRRANERNLRQIVLEDGG